MLEIFAVIFTLACVYLTTKNKVLSWPIGIIGVILYSILFFQVNLYAEVIIQIVFLLQSLYGWYNWSKLKDKPSAKITETRIKDTPIFTLMNYFSFIIYFTIFLTYILSTYTNASIPLIDSFTASISLLANWLLAKRKLENWYLWIFVDVIYVGMFAYKTLYLTSALYFIFFFMAIYGLKNWKKERLQY